MSKGAVYSMKEYIAQIALLCRASSNGFSKYSDKIMAADATARYSPSGLISGFSGRPCPEIAES